MFPDTHCVSASELAARHLIQPSWPMKHIPTYRAIEGLEAKDAAPGESWPVVSKDLHPAWDWTAPWIWTVRLLLLRITFLYSQQALPVPLEPCFKTTQFLETFFSDSSSSLNSGHGHTGSRDPGHRLPPTWPHTADRSPHSVQWLGPPCVQQAIAARLLRAVL